MAEYLLEGEQYSPEPERSSRKLSLKELLRVCFRHKKKIVFIALCGALASGYLYFRHSEIYRSEAKLLVRFITDSLDVDPDAAGQMVASSRTWTYIFNSELEILGSRHLAEITVDTLGVDFFSFIPSSDENSQDQLTDSERATFFLMNRLKITPLRTSNVIKLAFDAANPELAKRILSTYIQVYLAEHVSVHRATGSYDFLQQQSDQLKAKLLATVDELKTLKNEAGIVSLEEQMQLVTARSSALRDKVEMLETEIAGSQARISVVELALKDRPRSSATQESDGKDKSKSEMAYPFVERLPERLNRLRRQEMELLARYTEDSRPVMDIRKQINQIMTLMDGQMTEEEIALATDTNQDRLEVSLGLERAKLSSFKAELETTNRHLEAARQEAKLLNEVEGKLEQLEREKSLHEVSYRKFSEGLEQARIDHAIESDKISNISQIQPATLPLQKIRPVNYRNVVMALFLGVFGGLGLAFGLDLLVDHSMKDAEDIEVNVQEKVLASIPLISRKRLVNPLQWKTLNVPLLPARGNGSHGAGSGDLNLHQDIEDQFEVLGDQVLMKMGDNFRKPYLLGITSCYNGEGVSTVAAGLAITLARISNSRVLLVDANPKQSSVRGLFNTNQAKGVMDIRGDESDDRVTIIRPNLYTLSALEVTENGPAMKATQRLDEMVDYFRQSQYDILVLDLPSIIDNSAPLRFMNRLDGVNMVVAAEQANSAVVKRVRDTLAEAAINLHGVILNKRRFYIPQWLYRKL